MTSRVVKLDENTRTERPCNICDKPAMLRKFERFCTPCRRYQEQNDWPGRPWFRDEESEEAEE